MYSTTVLLGLLLALATTAHSIAIHKPDESPSPATKAVVSTNNGFAVQSGYEGYLLNQQKTGHAIGNWLASPKLGILKSVLLPVSSFLLVYGAKTLGVILHLLLALFLGVATTTAVCSFTPLCTISVAGPALSIFKGQSLKEQVSELTRTYMTPNNLEMVSKFVQSALDKYSIAPRHEAEQPEPNVTENETTSSA
ncbi:PREDICTED: uncharacterized protein LOC105367918 [Ceratosolen solmsi marchali]|uniref:Uncharacterized protein LOC105367909 n=1 Tax=Ceratosolen solmsi marchali TaxID=326594 RepID=A0AAJ6YVE3_9HYME|nr:PREDICTED: uncharacterized protein LOC105367909 [Ceratosolen solmsi marchali]XP_011505082.1 PREDICTED: uncharacterized protein LOC105367918 [Ceratosolen solmsi marchali]